MMMIDNSVALQAMQKNMQDSSDLQNLNKDERLLREKTDEFEAIMIRTILDASLKMENELFPKEAGEDIYNFMYKDAISKSLSGAFGYSQLLFEFLVNRQKGGEK